MTAIFRGAAALIALVLTASAFFYAQPLTAGKLGQPAQLQSKKAESPFNQVPNQQFQQLNQTQSNNSAPETKKESTNQAKQPDTSAASVVPTETEHYVATAYAFKGRTASGKLVGKGVIAADPRILPLGSRVLISAGNYTGEYLVADTGSAIKGRRIDIWVPTRNEAFRFGRRKVKLTVLTLAVRRSKRGSKSLVHKQSVTPALVTEAKK